MDTGHMDKSSIRECHVNGYIIKDKLDQNILSTIIKIIPNYSSLVSPVSLSILQTLVIIPRSADIHHQGTEISQPLSVLPHVGA